MEYVLLLSSLPRHHSLFQAKRTPLSRIKLDRRLALLSPRHRTLLRQIEDALHWDRTPLRAEAAGVVARVDALLDALGEHPDLRRVVLERVELRTVMAALRARRMGRPPPSAGEPWGMGRFLFRIRGHWNEPHLGLEGAMPWIRTAVDLLDRDETAALDRLLLGEAWRRLRRVADRHDFDFEAVVVYVLRWNIVERWTRYDGAAAVSRFDLLVEQCSPLDANTWAMSV